MPEDSDKNRRVNTTGALFKNQLGEMLKAGISAANGEELEQDYHEGEGSHMNFEGFPKEYFTKRLEFKDKIDLVLDKKEVTLPELAIDLGISMEELNLCIKKNVLPKEEVLKKLADYSSYPIDFFKAPPMMDATKNNHKRNVIIAVSLVIIITLIVIYSIIHITVFM